MSCHACYDAPCQLDLSTYEGIVRGGNKQKVYEPSRLIADEPTRIGRDAFDMWEWRSRGFYSLLKDDVNTEEPSAPIFEQVLKKPVSHKHNAILQHAYDLSLSRDNACPAPSEYQDLSEDQQFELSMPFAMRSLTDPERAILLEWVDSGMPEGTYPDQLQPSATKPQALINAERFLNRDSNYAQLVARYIYEHIFLAAIQTNAHSASDTPYDYRLVRSATPPNSAHIPIRGRRPYSDPAVNRVYYRFIREERTRIAKTHLPYLVDQAKVERWQALFHRDGEDIPKLPMYSEALSANPFKIFSEIPHDKRYQFMLDNALFYVEGFMKGPVCRGQVALNVINDHFWVTFVEPNHSLYNGLDTLLHEQENLLSLPAEHGSTTIPGKVWLQYGDQQKSYLDAKATLWSRNIRAGAKVDTSLVWRESEHAALTLFRHFDSASVIKGFHGSDPKTTWLIDYPILERIHYLLVAGFDVYGNLAHQLETRLYMDFLRMESELNFLMLLPLDHRNTVLRRWYKDQASEVRDYISATTLATTLQTNVTFPEGSPDAHPPSPQKHLHSLVKRELANVLTKTSKVGRDDPLYEHSLMFAQKIGADATRFPELSLILVDLPQGARVYTLLRNSAHRNITSVFRENSNREPADDTLLLLNGVVGAYPDALYYVPLNTSDIVASNLDKFFQLAQNASDDKSFDALRKTFGVRRTHQDLWTFVDYLHNTYAEIDPVNAATIDLSRLENR